MSTIPQLITRKRNEFIKEYSVGRGVNLFDFEILIQPMALGLPKIFSDDIYAPINASRQAVMQEVQPHMYKGAAELSKLLTTKSACWKNTIR